MKKTPLRKIPASAAAPKKPRSALQKAQEPIKNAAFPIVGVGASAGGLEAFQQLLSALPATTGMAFVLIQHLAPKHESVLTELLGRKTRLPVVEATEGSRVLPNHIYVIPPNALLTIKDGVLRVAPLEDSATRRMPIDHFLRSLADDQHTRAIGVILSGTASDGTLGLQAIKTQGGITFAQDDKTAKYSAMPRNAIAAGSVDFVLPPDKIAQELDTMARHIHVIVSHELRSKSAESVPDENLNRIFGLLKIVSHVDFGFYKPGTIRRRITRRMFLRKIETFADYVQFLRKNADEVEALFHDLLINVTGFFRDPEAFDVLKSSVFPAMMSNKPSNHPIRIWVPGCSTGEEAYSLAIALAEYLGDALTSTPVQIFATDVSDAIIQKARAGIYAENVTSNVSADQLRRFFVRMDGGYQLTKTIRDLCIFAKQDITRDPPFSKLDMISCRNVMIYLGSTVQKRVIPLFHYALIPGGVLFLGSSETVGGFADLFSVLDKKFKIYTRKALDGPIHLELMPQFGDGGEPLLAPEKQSSFSTPDLQRMANQILLNRYAPSSVLVNDSMDIVQFFGRTGAYLEPSPGDASLNLMKMAKSGLHLELRVAFQKAKKNGPVRREGLLIDGNDGLRPVNIEVIPLTNPGDSDRHYVVVFEETGSRQTASQKMNSAKTTKSTKKAKLSKGVKSLENAETERLTEELDATREYLQSIIEEQRTMNEELRSANEEIQSSNEELQSINEELETAKEELQSTNEELTTVNEELQNRNDELSQLNNDLNNLLSSVSIPIIMLGNDLRIRRFTPASEKVMNLIPTDIGRPITDIKPKVKIRDLKKSITDVIDSLKIDQTDVEDQNGKWYSMKIRPYRTMDNKIDGVVIVLLDSRGPEAARR